MRAEAEQAVQALITIVGDALGRASLDDLEATREKHAGVLRSTEELRRLGVDVPDTLVTLLDQLRTQLDTADEAYETLEYVRTALLTLGSQIEAVQPVRLRRGDRSEGQGSRGPREPSLRPRGFIVEGTHYPADNWTELICEVARVMEFRHPDEFDRVLTLHNNRGRPLFSRNPDELDRPLRIGETGIFLAGRLSSDGVTRLAIRLADFFGYGDGQFSVLEPD